MAFPLIPVNSFFLIQFHIGFSLPATNFISSLSVESWLECGQSCLQDNKCSFFYHRSSSSATDINCQLSNEDKSATTQSNHGDWTFYKMQSIKSVRFFLFISLSVFMSMSTECAIVIYFWKHIFYMRSYVSGHCLFFKNVCGCMCLLKYILYFNSLFAQKKICLAKMVGNASSTLV